MDNKISLTIDYDTYDFLADTKKDLQKIARGKLRIDFDNAIEFLKAKAEKPQLTHQIFVYELIKAKKGAKTLEH